MRKEVLILKIKTTKEYLSLNELNKLHNLNTNVCYAHSKLNVSTVNATAKVHSRRKLELDKDDLLKFFNQKEYATYQVALNRQNKAVPHLMPLNFNHSADFANLLKVQLTKFINKQYHNNVGIVIHFDESVPNAHVFFNDYDSNSTTQSYQPHLKSNTNNDDNKQQTQEAKAKQQQEQLQQQLRQLRQRQVQIAIKIAEDKKKKLEKQRQMRLRRRRYRQNDGPDL